MLGARRDGSTLSRRAFSEHSVMTHIRQETSKGNQNGRAFKKNFICTLLKEIRVDEKTQSVQHGKALGQLSNLIERKKTQTRGKVCGCRHCQRPFVNTSSFKVHMRHPTGEKPYECKDCGKAVTHGSYLTDHRRAHGKKPSACVECGKAFTRSTGLLLHMRIHTGEDPYECKKCGKAFIHSSYLTKHGRILIGAKPYLCEECGKTYSFLRTCLPRADTHWRKPSLSKECGKAFNNSSALSRHVRTHAGQEPCENRQYGKTFPQSSGLTTHLGTHTEGRPLHVKNVGKLLLLPQIFICTCEHTLEKSPTNVKNVGKSSDTPHALTFT